MDRCDFCSIMTCLKNHISESNQMSQPEFLYEIFADFMDSQEIGDFSLDNGLVCRWMTGQAKISPKISSYYAKPSKQELLAATVDQNLMPLMADSRQAIQDVYTLFIQDDTISKAKKTELSSLYKTPDSQLLFLAKLISFGMERQFVKRDARNRKLIAGGALSPAVLNYIMDSEVPKPCRHFLGRENELEKLHAILEENSKIFLYGIAGIGKSELAKAYAKIYSKEYTNILYLMYSGDLRQDIIDLDFADDLPEVMDNIRSIADALEKLRGTMILLQYHLLHNRSQASSVREWIEHFTPVLSRYKGLTRKIKEKRAEKKTLAAEKKALSLLQPVRYYQISQKITTLTEEIEELLSQKERLIFDNYFHSETELKNSESICQKQQDFLNRLDQQYDTLSAQLEDSQERFQKLKASVSSEKI